MSGVLGKKYQELTKANSWKSLYVVHFFYGDDHSLVKLQTGAYINANHLILKDVGRHYILTQSPVRIGIHHFWQMIFDYNVRCIIMLNRLYENMQYFPGKEDGSSAVSTPNSITAGNFNLDLKKEEHKTFYTENKEFNVQHYQYNTWPDHGIPDTTEHFLEFLSEAEKTKDLSKIDIKQMIVEYRRSRMKLIQTLDQLQFAWKVVVDALDNERWKSLVESTCFDDA